MAAVPTAKMTKPYAVYRLNTTRGITNIGSHPDNDIVIQDPAVLPFHLMLDHRQKPYQVYILSPNADVCISGVRLAGDESKGFYDFGQIQFAGYTLRAQETAGDNPVEEVAVLPVESVAPIFAVSGAATAAVAAIAPGNGGNGGGPTLTLPGAPHLDDVILLNVAEPQAVVNVDQDAVYTLTVINGGPIVASFDIQVDGVPPEWVQVLPPRLNLYEGARATAEIRVTAPRDPTSLAKTYPLQFAVSSPNYPGLVSTASAEYTLNPYDEYAVGNISPRSKTASYGTKAAAASFTISNFGNHPAGFRVSAQDEENGCQFSFPQPGGTTLVKQADVQVDPGTTATVPLTISPLRRSLLRLSSKQYQYTVNTHLLDDPTSMRMLPGTFISRPLFGLFHVVLAVLILVVGGYFLLKPRIDSFGVKAKIIRLGETASLTWKVSPFTSNLQISGIADAIKAGTSELSTVPVTTATTYTLTAGNWLSSLLKLDIHSQPVTVLAIPSYPEIDTFTTDTNSLFQGDNLTVKWATKNASEVYLTIEGVTESLKAEEFSGTRTVPVKSNTLVVLQAKNNSGAVQRSTYVAAVKPSAKVVSFDVTPQTITKGSPVTVSWEVSGDGVQTVMISPFTDPLPNTGNLTFFPDASMEFILTVKSRGDKQLQPEMRSVGVLDAAAAPTISIFNVIPTKLTIPGNVEVSWSVTGATTNIKLTSLDGVIAEGLPAQGFRSVAISKTTSLILTAYNGTLSDAKSKDVEYSALKPVSISITSVTPNSGLLLGDTVLVQFSVNPLDSNGKVSTAAKLGYPELSGTVNVTNGFDNCDPVPTLPATSCQLKLTRITGQPIYATYSGDSNYARTTSGGYSNYSVSGQPAVLTTAYTYGPQHGSNLVVGEPFTIGFTFSPLSTASTVAVTGKVDVYDVTGGGSTKICTNIELANTDKNNPLYATGSCPMTGFSSVGQKSLKFVFKDSPAYASSPPVDSNLYVSKAETVVSFLYDLSGQTVVGQSFTVTMVVKAKLPGGGIPTGKVSVWDSAYDDTDNSCNPMATIGSDGTGTCSITLWHASPVNATDATIRDPKTIGAAYQGDANYNGSQVSDSNHIVNPGSTAVNLSFSPASGAGDAQVGQALKVTFAVSPTGNSAGSPSGSVSLMNDTTVLSQCNLNYPTMNNCSLVIPSYDTLKLRGSYTGSTDYLASDSGTVNYPVFQAVTSITAYASPASVAGSRDTVTFYPTVSTSLASSIVPAGTITILGDQPASESDSCTYPVPAGNPCDIVLIGQGARTITLTFTPSSMDFLPSSTTLDYRIKRSVTVDVGTYQTSPMMGQDVIFNFSVFPTDGLGGVPTSSVTVKAVSTDGTITRTCTDDLTVGWCAIEFSKATTYNITGSYSGDDIFAAVIDAPSSAVAVAPADTQIGSLNLGGISTIHTGDLFNLEVTVLNNHTGPSPSGTVYLVLASTNLTSPLNRAALLASSITATVDSQGIATFSGQSFTSTGTMYINVYYEDPQGNFLPCWFAQAVTVYAP